MIKQFIIYSATGFKNTVKSCLNQFQEDKIFLMDEQMQNKMNAPAIRFVILSTTLKLDKVKFDTLYKCFICYFVFNCHIFWQCVRMKHFLFYLQLLNLLLCFNTEFDILSATVLFVILSSTVTFVIMSSTVKCVNISSTVTFVIMSSTVITNVTV